MSEHTLILGCGYVGRALADALPQACFTHSNPEKALANGGVYFRLDDRDSWGNLPAAENIIWTFPAMPDVLVREFYATLSRSYQRLWVYGSTSCYLTQENDELVTESHPLDMSQARVRSEEYLRQQGATVLVLSGIYGPDREPLNWLRSGRIRSLQKRVNLIHRDDIVAITLHLLQNNGLAGERINLSDGHSRRWSEIVEHFGITVDDSVGLQKGKSKRISNVRLCELLPVSFRFESYSVLTESKQLFAAKYQPYLPIEK